MKNLQDDASTGLIHCRGDRAVLAQILGLLQHQTTFIHHPFGHGGVAAGKDEADLTRGTGRVEGRQSLMGTIHRFQARMHCAHHHAIRQIDPSDAQGAQEVWIG
ncbi:hypothetical protein AX27061_4767 [Achromobacter xylosoxidans NBRC 15126 = ATCC 27061]|nr:hypothetical protein AX27061_4767 [Achromobacter xylosoxidans NBRC 15126 = ATCC 27061]